MQNRRAVFPSWKSCTFVNVGKELTPYPLFNFRRLKYFLNTEIYVKYPIVCIHTLQNIFYRPRVTKLTIYGN